MLIALLFTMRFVRPTLVVAIFLLGIGLGWSMSTYNQDAATSLLLMRADTLAKAERVLREEGAVQGSASAQRRTLSASQEALRALRELYIEEEELWTYYAAIQESIALRESLASAQQAASSVLAEQAGELARVDALVERLRPSAPPSSFQFTAPMGPTPHHPLGKRSIP